MKKVKTVLISVFDKTALVPFAKGLQALGIKIISTGQTARLLRESGVKCTDVAKITSFPEMLDGRVKTLHPKIHAGLLAMRSKATHVQMLKKHRIPMIDMVVVNLYPFAQALRLNKKPEETIEMIDIGGPAMLRAAAKNFESVAAVCDIRDYSPLLTELKRNQGALSEDRLRRLSAKAFGVTSAYDALVADYLSRNGSLWPPEREMPARLHLEYRKLRDLRYGENPHQRGALYQSMEPSKRGLPTAEILGGKELSYNNYLDMEAAWSLVQSFHQTAACVVKHSSPCGVALHRRLSRAFQSAFACDPLSAFGGIVGVNRKVDGPVAKAILKSGFLECVVAPGFTKEALNALRKKKNLRLVKISGKSTGERIEFKKITGGLLLQDRDSRDVEREELKFVTRQKPTETEIRDLLFAFQVSRFVKSNAIVVAKGLKTVGIGSGQPSRVDSALVAFRKAGRKARGAVMASDGFFPKPDSIQSASKSGIRSIIQPGGSIQDPAVIQSASRLGIRMVLAGIRHFTH